MIQLDELKRRWDAEASKLPILDVMTFEDGFLTLGAGTRLAKIGAALDEPRRRLARRSTRARNAACGA